MFSTWAEAICQYTKDECPKGTFAVVRMNACQLCPNGKYSDVVGIKEEGDCKGCAVGLYSNEVGNTIGSQCKECPRGNYTDKTASIVCSGCPSGTYGDQLGLTASSDCKQCVAGQFTNVIGRTACVDCRLGFWQSATGETSCIGCAPGYYGKEEGLVDQADCTDCPIGFFTDVLGRTSCPRCPVGKTSDVEGSVDCPAHDKLVILGGVVTSMMWTKNLVVTSSAMCNEVNGRRIVKDKDECVKLGERQGPWGQQESGAYKYATGSDSNLEASSGKIPKGCAVRNNGDPPKLYFKKRDSPNDAKCGKVYPDGTYSCVCVLECPSGQYQDESGQGK